MDCKKCGKEIPDSSVFCNWCGAKQITEKHRTRRGNGQGTVYKRGNVWQAEVTLGYYMKDGKIKRKRVTKSGFAKKADAINYIHSLRTETERKSYITVSELWEQFRTGELLQLSATKQSGYKTAFRKIEKYISYKNIDELTTKELQQLVDKAGSSFYTKRDIKTLMSHLYKLAIRDDYCDKNKAQYIRLPKLETAEREIFTPAEIDKLWNDYTATGSVISAHILLMLYTGMRPGELLGALKANINLEEQYMTGGIKTEKGRKRKIIIPDKAVPIVKELIDKSSTQKLSGYRVQKDFYDDFNQKRDELKLNPSLLPYCCRHTFVTNATRLNLSPALLQELVGHEDYEQTLAYNHMSIKDRLDAVNKL